MASPVEEEKVPFWSAFSKRSRGNYRALHSSDPERIGEEVIIPKERNGIRCFGWTLLALAVFTTSALVATLFQAASKLPPKPSEPVCIEPQVRREWRALEPAERLDYIDAMLCLTKTPSLLTEGASIYDDLTNVHVQIAPRVHHAAPFFPWHRLFLHFYESMLREHCDYDKPLPYWDWTLDWDHLATSVVWDDTLGFGGDGNRSQPSPYPITYAHPLQSYCLTSGPFKDVRVMYGDDEAYPHCIARRFYHFEKQVAGQISGNHLAPTKMHALERAKDYDELRNGTEIMLHNSIHWGVGGDFKRWSSPNDPIFYLHHVQLDRIWWQWQQLRPQRLQEYFGPKENGSMKVGSLMDKLSFNGLWRDIRVEEGMQTDGGLLCYTY